MKKHFYKPIIITITLLFSFSGTASDIVIKADTKKAKKVKPIEYGFHYEEIGMIGEGGLHAELIRNRGFEEATPPKGLAVKDGLYQDVVNPTGNNKKVFHVDPLIGWTASPASYSPIRIERTLQNPMNENNPHSMLVTITEDITDYKGKAAVYNTGFYGMNFRKGIACHLSFYVKSNGYAGTLSYYLTDENGKPISEAGVVENPGKEWTRYEVTLVPKVDVERGMLSMVPSEAGRFQLDMVSLFPSDTWDNGKSIFRKDIMQNLKEYAPDFIRFPGGCIVHGVNEETMYHWKETIGDIAQRPGAWSKWAPYYRSDGLGYHEFYELCEYLGADAMYVIPTGMVCTEFLEEKGVHQFIHKEADIDYYIQEALDAIEYAIGTTDTRWGSERAKNGHSEPFPLKYVEIGNEDFGPVYYERYDKIYRAIKAEYPQLTLIANSIIFRTENDKRKYLKEFKSPEDIEVYDEHYYQSIEWAVDNHYKFDAYDRSGPDLFIGELGIGGKYPARILAEGIVKLSMERNADLNPLMADRPLMRSYDFLQGQPMVPLLLHTSSVSLKTFNYYLCKMLRDNKIDICYDTKVLGNSGTNASKTLFATIGKNGKTNEYIIKIINLSDQEQSVRLEIPAISREKTVNVTLLTAGEEDFVTPRTPDAVKMQQTEKKVGFPTDEKIAPYSFTVYRVK